MRRPETGIDQLASTSFLLTTAMGYRYHLTNKFIMKTRFLSTLVLLALCLTTHAYDVEVDGIYYNLDLTTLEATVTSGGRDVPANYYSGNVVVPDSFVYGRREFKVTAVDYGAFTWNSNLNSVTLPNSIKTIGEQAFIRCENLTNVKLPDSITEIPRNCFNYCKKLKHIDIPNSVTSYGYGSFTECDSLGPTFVVGANVTILYGSNWSSCYALKKLIIEDSSVKLQSNGFHNPLDFSRIDSIYVGRPVDFDFSYLFMEDMNYVELGPTLKTGDIAGLSDKLKTLVSDIVDPTQLVPDFSNTIYLNTTLYVPKGKVDAYSNAEGWKNFFDIRENDGTITKINNVTKAKTATATSYYNLSGQTVSKDYKGVVIVRSSDGSSKKVLNK